MSLFDTGPGERRRWARVGDYYTVTKKPRNLDLSSFETIPFVPMDAIPQGGAYAPTFTPKSTSAIASGTYFERGDILLAKITPSFENGKQALTLDLTEPFGYATTEVVPLQPHNTGYDRRLLFFYLLHPDIRHHVTERMEGSTGRKRVPASVILDLHFPVFEPEEQEAICDSLELIQRRKLAEIKSEQTTKALKTSVMQTLFTRGLRGQTQKETQIGPVPESWELRPLGALCERTDTVDPLREGERIIEYVDVSSVSREFLTIEGTTRSALQEAPGRARKRILEGDVLFATVRPTLLRVAYIPSALNDHVCSTAFCVLRRNPKKVADKFLYYVVQRDPFIQQLAAIESGASYPAVTDRIVKEQLVPVPHSDEQRAIVTILDAIDRKIDLHRRKRAVLGELFKALLHKLMTGETRVSELDLSAIGEAGGFGTRGSLSWQS